MGSLNRNTGHHGKKAQRKGMMALAMRVMQSIGLGDTKVAELLDIKPARVKFNRSKYQPHQGEGEMARRRKQIAKGQLQFSNGLRTNMCVVSSPVGQKIFDTPQQAMFYMESD